MGWRRSLFTCARKEDGNYKSIPVMLDSMSLPRTEHVSDLVREFGGNHAVRVSGLRIKSAMTALEFANFVISNSLSAVVIW
jgi:hypothetical protein